MSRVIRVTLVGSALALFVYAGAAATDAQVDALASVVQTALQTDAPTEWTDIFYVTDGGTFDYLIFYGFLLFFFGLKMSGGRPGSLFSDRGSRA